ncbi:hypothetical protein I5589_05475 [Burkholderia vietnamiensis]|uniref:Uncharacterized protein n=1 Tax=Burkholderia vietnamiensis TaxID=60552 RepID=A0ABS1AQV2_BURVI|nr:hypothetical protein [Burkholderia vietnamiensis]MBJ9686529.1 hypothetical protein [Burkholderia vietnamiensis]
MLQVPFENDDAFDRRVDGLLVAIAVIAEQHGCTLARRNRADEYPV